MLSEKQGCQKTYTYRGCILKLLVLILGLMADAHSIIRRLFDRARSIACESLVCAKSIAYNLIACQVIASDQDSLDIIG